MISRKQYELFETKWLMMRQNPGGKSAYLQKYLLGFNGTIDITTALTAGEGTIKIKVGNADVQTIEVDFSDYTPDELTPAKAVQALNAALDTGAGCTFSVDNTTKRLKLASANPSVRFIQIYGDLAGALHFGDSRFNEGKGCYLFPSFDNDLKSVAETEQWNEDTVIENDSHKGTPVKLTIPGKRTGTQIVITDRQDSRAAKQMINGGRWIGGTDTTPDIYEPPTASSGESPRVDVFTFSEVYNKNTNVEGDEAIIRERLYIGCVGRQTKTGGAGSWSDGEYSLTAADYVDENGDDKASPRESDYTKAQWDEMQMSGVLVLDWENA
jgi:hypothetical protein